jgi:ketosteroid isomerase-like protein
VEGERARTAREIWHAFARRDAEAIVALGGERAEWRPARAPQGLRGRAALEAYFEGLEREGVVEEAIAHRVEEIGRVVVITGAVREQRGGSGYVEATRSWICVFRDDTIAWGASCTGAGEIRSTLAALGAA